MKKIYVVITVLILCFSLGACSKPAEIKTPEEKIQVENKEEILTTVRNEIIETLEIDDAMFIEKESLNSLYGIDENSVKNCACFVTISGTFPHEIIMIEATEESKVAEIEECLEKKLGEVLIQSKSYDPENYKLAQQCKVYTKGNYITLFLSPENLEMKTILDKYI